MAQRIQTHPCYCEEAARRYARLHLPVAPRCNVQCGYCHRRYDCANESRPGVASEQLSPQAALQRLQAVQASIPQLTVVGIAGPGDPLADPRQTFETFQLVHQAFPHLKLCLSTNGLALPAHLAAIQAHHIEYVTVTVNAIDPAIGQKIYTWVRHEGTTYRHKEAAAILWAQQQTGIKSLVERRIQVKVNTILIPGVNDQHIADIARTVSALGVHLLNVTPLIPLPGTTFAAHRPPTLEERRTAVRACAPYLRIMRHCCQCRADAAGLLNQDRSAEFARATAGQEQYTERA